MRPGSINCASVFNGTTKSGFANAHAPTGSTSSRLPRNLYQSFQEDGQNDLLVKHLVKHPDPLYFVLY